MSEWEESQIRQLKLQRLRDQQGAKMRAELSKLGPIVALLIRLCIILTINGAALSILIWVAETICWMLNLHPSITYSITHLVGANHSFAIPQEGVVYYYGSSLMSGLFKVPHNWGGYTAFSYVSGWFAVGVLVAVVIPLGAAIALYHSIIGANPVGFTKAIGLACASTVGIGLFSINVWIGIAIVAMLVAPILQVIINSILNRSSSGRRITYSESVALILAFVVFRKRLARFR